MYKSITTVGRHIVCNNCCGRMRLERLLWCWTRSVSDS